VAVLVPPESAETGVPRIAAGTPAPAGRSPRWKLVILVAWLPAFYVASAVGLYLWLQTQNTARVLRAAQLVGRGDYESALTEYERCRGVLRLMVPQVPVTVWRKGAAMQCVDIARAKADVQNLAIAEAALARARQYDPENHHAAFFSAKLDAVRRPQFIVPQDYPTISEAIGAAPEKSVILIRPGRYREALRVAKEITLVGEGPREGVIIENDDGAVLVTAARAVVVVSLTLRGAMRMPPGRKDFGVRSDGGVLELADCDVTSGSMACVAARGPQSGCVVRFSRVRDCLDGGGVCIIGGKGIVEDSELAHNKKVGAQGIFGGELTVQRCAIYGGAEGGVLARNGVVTVEDCDVRDQALGGVDADEKGKLFMRRSRISCASGAAGFQFSEGAEGTIEDCVVTAVARPCVIVATAAAPFFRKCRFAGGQSAVYVYDRGKPVLEDCEITGAGFAGVDVRTGGAPVLRRCRIYDNSGRGINVRDEGRGEFEDCLVEKNMPFGVESLSKGAPVLRRCKINRNEYGVYIYDGAKATFIDCDLTGNRCGAWRLFNAECVKIEGGRTQ
jgi:hypothetical protein